MSANKPLKTPDDLLGLKMRIQSSKVLEAQMKAWGAVPQVMAFSEVYQALQTGVVDGTENPPSNMYTQKMHEVQKYAALTRHGYLGYAVIVNKKFWDGLPADIRANLEKAMAEATEYANDIAQKENDDALEAMEKSGKTEFHTLTDAERKAWVASREAGLRRSRRPRRQGRARRGRQGGRRRDKLSDDRSGPVHGACHGPIAHARHIRRSAVQRLSGGGRGGCHASPSSATPCMSVIKMRRSGHAESPRPARRNHHRDAHRHGDAHIFVAVVHRYSLTAAIDLANLGRAHEIDWLFLAGRARL